MATRGLAVFILKILIDWGVAWNATGDVDVEDSLITLLTCSSDVRWRGPPAASSIGPFALPPILTLRARERPRRKVIIDYRIFRAFAHALNMLLDFLEGCKKG